MLFVAFALSDVSGDAEYGIDLTGLIPQRRLDGDIGMQPVCLRYRLLRNDGMIPFGYTDIQFAECVRGIRCKQMMVGSTENLSARQAEDLFELAIHELESAVQVLDIHNRLRVVDDGLQQLFTLSPGGDLRMQGFVDRLQLRGAIEYTLFQLLVGEAQCLRRTRDRRLQSGIDDREQECRAENERREHRDRDGEPVRIQAGAAGDTNGVRREMSCRHSRIVHTDDRRAHDGGSRDLVPAPATAAMRQAEGNPQCGYRGRNCDEHRCRKQQGVVVDAWKHLHRRHAGVVHSRDTDANEHARHREAARC